MATRQSWTRATDKPMGGERGGFRVPRNDYLVLLTVLSRLGNLWGCCNLMS
jgi:hypothetical protein